MACLLTYFYNLKTRYECRTKAVLVNIQFIKWQDFASWLSSYKNMEMISLDCIINLSSYSIALSVI